MTMFEKDLKRALNGEEIGVLTRRQKEIADLIAEGKKCKNKFRMKCIAQEVARLKWEYNEISKHFD